MPHCKYLNARLDLWEGGQTGLGAVVVEVVLLFSAAGGVVGWRLSGRRRRRRWAMLEDDTPDGFFKRSWQRLPRTLRRVIVTLVYAALGAVVGLVYVALTKH